ncbi:hypothetical protein FA15DRAFT_203801 [Coprinopsis marcescibilis]|uniref:Uncharacterized protein n=1 Tax=Coprinopsis marcescibilis TaxID=230819 RepID=A0A5C3LBQ4_COPMA|nr:hypothetical protein FA15DRAFT_203801 [Coprinopsis marcescibilis]
MASPRLVYFDDVHKDINYDGEWAGDLEQYSSSVGFIYGGSQHQTTGNSSMSFEFWGMCSTRSSKDIGWLISLGTAIYLFGRTESIAAGDEDISAKWTCRIDGLEIEARTPRRATGINHQILCGEANMPGDFHTLSVSAEGTSGIPFWIDAIAIAPLLNLTYDTAAVQVRPDDAAFQYQDPGSWSTVGDARYTTQPGTSLFFYFNGTKITWLSEHLPNPSDPLESSQGIYTIDNLTAVPFDIPGLAVRDLGHRILFETEQIPYGDHRINITYLGSSAPLVLDSVWIQDGDILPPQAPVTTPSVAPPSDPPTGDNNFSIGEQALTSSNLPVGAIAGGTIGGIVALVLICFGLYFFVIRRRRRHQLQWKRRTPPSAPFVGAVGAVGVVEEISTTPYNPLTESVLRASFYPPATPQPYPEPEPEPRPSTPITSPNTLLPPPYHYSHMDGRPVTLNEHIRSSIYDRPGDSAVSEKARSAAAAEQQDLGHILHHSMYSLDGPPSRTSVFNSEPTTQIEGDSSSNLLEQPPPNPFLNESKENVRRSRFQNRDSLPPGYTIG